MKSAKLLTTPILRNICKVLLPEVFHKKAVLKNFAIKVASDKCSVKKVFLMVDRAVKVMCFDIDQHVL